MCFTKNVVVMKSLFLLLLAFFAVPSLAQAQADIPVQYFNFKAYGRAHGLNASKVSGITEDSKGTIWVTSSEVGVFQFDGHEFIEAKGGDTATINIFDGFKITDRDTIWGASIWGGKEITAYHAPTKRWAKSKIDKIYGSRSLSVDKDSGTVYSSLNSAIYTISYRNGEIVADTLFDFGKDYYLHWTKLLIDKYENLLWGIVYNVKVRRYELFSLDKSAQKLNLYPISNDVADEIYQDENGEIYVGVRDNHLFVIKKIDKSNATIHNYFTYFFPQYAQRAYIIGKYKQDFLLYIQIFGESSLYRFNVRTHQLTKLQSNPAQSIPSDIFDVIFTDSKGNLWLGMESTETPLVFIPNQLQHIQFRTLPIPKDTGLNYFGFWWVSAFLEIPQENRVYIATYFGAGLHIADTNLNVKEVINSRVFLGGYADKDFAVNCILKDRNGRLWVNVDNSGLFYYNSTQKKLLQYENYGEMRKLLKKNEMFYQLYEDSEGYLWTGTKFDGIFRIAPDRQSFEHYPSHFGMIDDFDIPTTDTHYRHIIEHNQKIYIATQKGIRVFDMRKKVFETNKTLAFF